MQGPIQISGSCYCGRTSVSSRVQPDIVTYCHCDSCRKVSGAPVTAWAAFPESEISFRPDEGRVASPNKGVSRSFCPDCGSPLAHRYDYAPDQVFVGVGLLDQASELEPTMHSHSANCLPWLNITDTIQRMETTSRTQLSAAAANRKSS